MFNENNINLDKPQMNLYSVSFQHEIDTDIIIETIKGQSARVLTLLHKAGRGGIVTSDAIEWCHRLSQYISVLRRRCRLEIITEREPRTNMFGDRTWQARYTLLSDIEIITTRK